jgi:hypothetical protein
MAHLTLCAWEAALRAQASNGHPLPADVRWMVERLALAVPVTAARCPRVRAVLPPDVRAAVLRAAAAQGSQALAGRGSQAAVSAAGGWLSARDAARVLGITPRGVRAACRRGRLAAARDEAGVWRIEAASVAAYRER